MKPSVQRLAAWLAGLWAGVLLAIAAIAAPAAFAVLSRPDAGRYVGRVFAMEAYLSLAAGVLLVLMGRRFGRGMHATVLLPLGAIFCTVAGYFALLPMMEQARAGQGPLSFAALHGASAVFFAVKGLLVAVLAWRLTRPATSS